MKKHLDVFSGEHLIGKALKPAEAVPAVDDVDLFAQVGKIQGVFQRAVAAADDRGGPARKKASVTGRAVGNAGTGQTRFVSQAQFALFSARRQDYGFRLQNVGAAVQPLHLARKLRPFNRLKGERSAGLLCVGLHFHGEFRAVDPGKARIVVYFIGGRRLPARKRRIRRPACSARSRAVNGGRQARGTRSDDDYVIHTAPSRISAKFVDKKNGQTYLQLFTVMVI